MHIHGAKKQKGGGQKPHIAPDDLVSVSYANIMYGLAEGEIYGLADGGKSIRLDGTPLINDDGQPNFTDVNWEFRNGTLDQSHIAGFPAVENETNVGVELRSDRPWVKAINNRELSAVRVRLNFNALREQDDSGNIKGYAIAYAIDVQTDGGSFVEVLTDTVRGKASQGYKKSHRIDLPNAGTAKRWTIRVRRITPNRNSDLIADTVHIDALTEIIDAKLTYPHTALLALSYNAKTFANIAKIAVRLKGKIIQVPSNYNAQTRTYTGLWDGTFKMAYSNNPAWVFYDLCTHRRYGLGERLSGMVDKWRLYQIGQYCDELVDDGKGGQEPRFTCNVYIQKADDAYRVLQNLASVFRGLSFWDGSNIVVDADTPKEPVYTFSPANVVGGEFAYTGTRARDRHTLAKVAWDNPENGFTTEYELIPDEQAIAKYGVRTLDISAFGCTSQGQAQRAGLWALKAEQLETQTVSFKTGLMGFIPQVGQVINVADNVFAGRAISGKIVAVSTNKRQITLDRVAGKVGNTLTVNGTDGVQSAKITAVRGQVLTLDKPINAENEHIWAVISDDLKLKQFRILTIAQNDDATFAINALEYNAQKYTAVDNGAMVTPQPYTALKATPITAPNSVTLTASTRTVQGQAVTTLSINWEQVAGATAYIVEWRKDDGNWQTLPRVSGQSVDIDGVYAGKYTARVRAVDSFDNESLATSSVLTTIAGKTGKPPRLARLVVKGVLFGMELGWTFNKGSEDTNFTEIQVSPDGRSNITQLGTFAYPTNKHEITGLQGNLTQFYRGRIVDKLGNTSDWTDWVSGTTSADADKVLDLIGGQINQSHLDQTLRAPIAKIGTLESAVNAVNSQLPQLNQQIANAVRDIGTERNRINTAIRDIGTLQTANNAKTQEIANLKQTVGGHTSSIRELGVTTGDLSQKYSQLKTASDTANSEITAIKQTQAGQATSIDTMRAVQMQGNLFDATTATNGAYLNISTGETLGVATHRTSDFIAVDANTWYEITAYNGDFIACRVVWYDENKARIKGRIVAQNGNYAKFNSDDAKFVRISSYWTRQANNLWKLNKMGVSGEILADMATLRQTVADGDNALSQRIDSLQSDYNGNKANIASQLKTLSDKEQALASNQSQLNARFDSIGKKIIITSQTDLNTLTQTGNYFIKAGTTNSPSQNWLFVDVENSGDDWIVKQTATQDNEVRNQWVRQRHNGNWSAWEKVATASDVATTQANIDDFKRVQANANDATAQKLSQLESGLGGKANATALNNYYTKAQTDEVISGRVERFEASLKRQEINAVTDLNTLTTQGQYFIKAGNNPNAPAANWLFVDVETSNDNWIVMQSVRQDNNAKNQWVRQRHNGVWSAWEKVATGSELNDKASATALNELNTRVGQVDGKITAEAQKISQLQTTVGGQTASIQQHAQSINGLNAQYTIKVQTGGVVAGIGLASQNGVSDFAVRADKFYIASPTGQKGKMPFMVLATSTAMNGVTVPAGTYIDSAFIANGSITMLKIADSIQSDNYVAGRQGWRLFKDGRFELNNTFGDGSSLELNSKGLIVWYNKAQGKKAVELGILT